MLALLRITVCSVVLAVILMSSGIAAQAQEKEFSLEARRADFKTFCDQFLENYAYLDRPEAPWKTWLERYSKSVDAAKTPESYAAVFEAALDELHDFHAEVRSHNPHRYLPVPTFADIWTRSDDEKSALVIAVRPGSDAERAGIVPGDKVTEVNGTPLEKAVTDRLTNAVDHQNPDARQWAILSLLAGRSDEERHFGVVGRNGKARRITLPQQRHFEREAGPLSFKTLGENVGYIRIHNSLGDQQTVAAFDAALEKLRFTTGLILDLRDVPSGGNSSVALGILGRFVRDMLPYQRHRIPNYGQSDIERNWWEMVAPRGPFPYTSPVVVLVDHWTGSMGEGMAVGFDAMHRAVVVGTEMAHLAGAVSDFSLPRTGIEIAFATEQIYHINGTPRHKWQPPVLVPQTGIAEEGDTILKRGLAELQQRLRGNAKDP